MKRTARMLSIIMQLQNGKTTLRKLADRFECSTKSIQRDLAQLIEMGIPVTTMRGRDGGISIDPSWWLGPLNLDSGEIETIILAMENSQFLPGAEEVLAKIRAAVRPTRFDAVNKDPQRPQIGSVASFEPGDTLPRIRAIIGRDLWCRINYTGGSKPGWRMVKPKRLHIDSGNWYMEAVDERSREFRTFRLDRILCLEPTLGPKNTSEIIEHALAQPAYRSDTYPLVVAGLTPAGLVFCQNHPRLRTCLDGSTLRFHCPPTDYPYMARDFLRMGSECTVVEPEALIAEMLRAARQTLAHLEKNQDTHPSS